MNDDLSDYDRIAEMIHCDSSPVGIDAKKTHILILQKLEAIQTRLQAIESELESRKR